MKMAKKEQWPFVREVDVGGILIKDELGEGGDIGQFSRPPRETSGAKKPC